ncbi:MAG TPA: TldD/PmbA family protein [bacterium]|nr:TldD/PmbA family protein [bacterium]
MEAQQAAEFVLALAREHRLPDVDLLVSREERLSLRVNRGRVEKVDQATAVGLGVRVVQEGRTGLAHTERLEAEALERAFLAARENASLQDSTPVQLVGPPPHVPDPESLRLYNPELERLTAADLAAFGLEVEATARDADSRVKEVPYLAVSRESGWYQVVSSRGVTYQQRSNSVGAACQVLLVQNGQRKSGNAHWSRRHWERQQAARLGREAVHKGAHLLGAKAIPSAALPVVLDEYCAPGLLGMFLGAFHAEAAQKGQSRLKGRLGEQIAEATLALTDEPHRPGDPGSRFLDAEGVPTQPLPLIQDGRFVNFLYHVESARKEGKASTGHAGRGYAGGIHTRSHNLVIPTGPHTLDELTALAPRCLLVTELEGGAGCNPLSGDISIGVQGFLVEGGRRVQPVDSVTIAGNFFDLLRAIRARGNAYQPHLSKLFIPPLLVDGLSIAG